MRYAVAYSKGGVGKTTIAVHLAAYLAQTYSTLLIDGDPQEHAASWITFRRENPKAGATPTTVRLLDTAILDEGRELAENFTHTVIDSDGRDGPGMRNALLLADRAIVPLGFEGFDSLDLKNFLEQVKFVQDFNRQLKVKVLLNQIHSQSKVGSFVEELNALGLEVFAQRMRYLLVYRRTAQSGLTVHEQKPRNGLAIRDMNIFYRELEEWT